ncbi:hypothetical protein D046_0318B, partial [Vibrio parahaemolyticus V-223/04]
PPVSEYLWCDTNPSR